MFFVFLRTKQGTKIVLPIFQVLLVFENKKQFLKTRIKQALIFYSLLKKMEFLENLSFYNYFRNDKKKIKHYDTSNLKIYRNKL